MARNPQSEDMPYNRNIVSLFILLFPLVHGSSIHAFTVTHLDDHRGGE
jgi:hypothetical protein